MTTELAGAKSETWSWEFDHPAAAVWGLMADTARFNEAAALPRHEITEIPQPDGAVRFYGRVRMGPFDIKWREEPVNWVSGQWFEHCRYFETGPLDAMCAYFSLEAKDGKSLGRYTLSARPKTWIGRLILATGFFTSSGRKFAKLAAEANQFAGGARATPFDYLPPTPRPETLARVARAVADIEATPNGHGLAQRLADHVLQAQEVDLWHIRPLQLARAWRRPALEAIELCLQAVRCGLLELRWDILCPRCRVAKAWSGGLDRLPTGAHCSSCNIDYERNFSQNVEASFRPAAAVRPLESGEYCLWGPMSTPHVKLQVALRPGETRTVAGTLPFGPYRLRSLEPGPETEIDWQAGGFPALLLGDDVVTAGPPAAAGQIRLENRSRRPLTAIVEDRSWLADALTADRITALQAFRDLFSDDVLRPGDEVSVGEITLLFSDLKGSTALYQQIGDASAYHLVRDHFALMAKIIRDHEGAIVKTIGDAVMAAFVLPANGVRAALAIARAVEGFNRDHAGKIGSGPAITIKLGLHHGPCIAVTLNDRLDYFGSTVNMAARLQGQSRGGDIVLSTAVAEDPSVRPCLAGVTAEPDRAVLKGFAEALDFLRIHP